MLTNNLFYFYGLQRSGTHAIINWILHQHRFTSEFEDLKLRDPDVWYRIQLDKLFLLYNYMQDTLRIPSKTTQNIIEENSIECVETAIISFESKCLVNLMEDRERGYEVDKVHSSSDVKDMQNIIILRDFPNFLASVYKKHGLGAPHLIKIWEDRAKEILGETNYLSDKIFINFNDLCTDSRYRLNICSKLGLSFTDIGFKNIAPFGGGSSFNNKDFKNSANKMNVLNRYAQIQDHQFKNLLGQHNNLVEMSNKIFK